MGLQPKRTQAVAANKMSFYDRGKYISSLILSFVSGATNETLHCPIVHHALDGWCR